MPGTTRTVTRYDDRARNQCATHPTPDGRAMKRHELAAGTHYVDCTHAAWRAHPDRWRRVIVVTMDRLGFDHHAPAAPYLTSEGRTVTLPAGVRLRPTAPLSHVLCQPLTAQGEPAGALFLNPVGHLRAPWASVFAPDGAIRPPGARVAPAPPAAPSRVDQAIAQLKARGLSGYPAATHPGHVVLSVSHLEQLLDDTATVSPARKRP